MDVVKSTPILRFNENHLQKVRKAVGYENISRLKQDIEQFDDWIKKQSHFRVKDFDLHFLERLLISNKGSIERAKQKLDKLCTCINLMPEFLRNFDIKNEFAPYFNVSDTCVLPTPTDDNCRIALLSLNGEEDDDYQLMQLYRYAIVISYYLLRNDYCHGIELVADLRKLTLNNVKKLNPLMLQKAMVLITECMGLRIKKIHLFNGSVFFDILLNLVKQGLSPKLRQRIVIHSSLESLHDHIPKEWLPKDFGGEELSTKELDELTFREMSSVQHIENVKFMEQAGTEESCRLTCTFNEQYSGMPGSFKTLCID